MIVARFDGVIESGFEKRNVTTELFSGDIPDHFEYWLSYTANQNWDVTTYMHHAEVRFFRGSTKIRFAHYPLNGKGGLAPTKWASVKDKMKSVLDELLSQF